MGQPWVYQLADYLLIVVFTSTGLIGPGLELSYPEWYRVRH
jgi:hypothetical protein